MRFRAGDRALYATGGSNYRHDPDRRRDPEDASTTSLATIDACREHGAPILSRGGGTSLAGQIANVAVVIDFSKYLNRIVEIDPRAQARAGRSPGSSSTTCANEAEARTGSPSGPDPSTHDHCTLGGMIGNNSCGVHSVMSQFYGPGPLTADQVHELDVRDLPRRPLHGRATPEPELARLISAGGPQGEIYASSATSATGSATSSASATRNCRAASRATTSTVSCPSTASTSPPRSTGTEGTCVTILEATVHLIDSPPDAQPARPRLRRRGHRRRPRPDGARAQAARARGRRRRPDRGHDARAPARRGPVDCCPTGAASCSSSSAARRRRRPTRRRTRSSRTSARRASTSSAGSSTTTGGRGRTSGTCARPASARRRSSRARRTRTRAGRTRPCRRSGSASTSASSEARREVRLRERALRPLRPGLHPRALELRPVDEGRASRRSGASSTTRPTSSSRWAARCRASTATASRARSCCRRCSATSSSRRSASSSRSGTPTGR